MHAADGRLRCPGGSRTLSVSTTSTIAVLTGSTLVAAGTAAGASDPRLRDAHHPGRRHPARGPAAPHRRADRQHFEATLVGIKIGVGLTVAAGQLPKLLGTPTTVGRHLLSEMRAVVEHLDDISLTTLMSPRDASWSCSASSVVPRGAVPLVAVAGGGARGAGRSTSTGWRHRRVPRPPHPGRAVLERRAAAAPGGLAIAMMVPRDRLGGARRPADPEPPIDNNQELLAGGLSCLAGGPGRCRRPAASQTAHQNVGLARSSASS